MVNKSLISRIKRIDWDFTGSYSESVFSNIHWHPGRFMSQLPAILIGMFSAVGDVVLDPFAGSGTTLVEAQRLGRKSIGLDIGIISSLISKSKTIPLRSKSISKNINRLIVDATGIISSKSKNILVPEYVQADKWYTKIVKKDLGRLWGLINTYNNIDRILAKAAFSSILLPVCREIRHWGYVCDNSKPKSNHEQNVLSKYCINLSKLKMGYKKRDKELKSRFGDSFIIEETNIINGDCIEVLKSFRNASVDLVLTSPPYFGVCDYIKSQRLSMEWFGYDIEKLRRIEIGARSKRHRKEAYAQYLFELDKSIKGVRNVLKSSGNLVFIIGQSTARKPVLNEIREILKNNNFSIDLDLNRKVSSQRRQAPSINEEHIFICS